MKKIAAAAALALLAILPAALPAKGTAPEKIAVAVSNPSSVVRTDDVRIDSPFDVEKVGSAVLTDGKSQIPVQLSGDVITFIAKDVPADGCKLYWLKPEAGKVDHHHKNCDAIENQFFRVTIDPHTNAISSIYSKPWKMELLSKGDEAGIVDVTIGTTREKLQMSPPDLIESGPSKWTIRNQFSHGNTAIVEDVTLYDSIPRIDVVLTVDWQEPAGGVQPTLRLFFPLGITGAKTRLESSGASCAWMDLSNNDWGVSLFSNKTFPCSMTNGAMSITLVAPNNPVKGAIFDTTCSLVPHAGGYDQAAVEQLSSCLENPLRAATANKR